MNTSCVLGLHSFALFNDMNYLEEKKNLIKWKSKKQSVVKRSNTEAKYRAMAHTASELIWLQHFLQKFSFRLLPIIL